MMMHQVAMFIALIPVLRLLPQAVYAVLGPWPYVATGLYLLHRLSFLFLANPYYYRLFLVGLALLSVVLLAWVLWTRRPRIGAALVRPSQKWVRLAGWGAIAALLVAIVANVRRQRLARRDADRRHPRERLRGARAVCRRDRARLDHPAAAGAQGAVAIHGSSRSTSGR